MGKPLVVCTTINGELRSTVQTCASVWFLALERFFIALSRITRLLTAAVSMQGNCHSEKVKELTCSIICLLYFYSLFLHACISCIFSATDRDFTRYLGLYGLVLDLCYWVGSGWSFTEAGKLSSVEPHPLCE